VNEESRSGPRPSRLGLVLAGGGAKGAYQAGVVDVLAGLGLPFAAIGGASIGALNGAVLASAPTLRSGAGTLVRMWRDVATTCAASGPVTAPPAWRESMQIIDQLKLLTQQVRNPVLHPDFISDLVTRHVDPVSLARGPRLWVTASASTDLDLVSRRFGWLADVARVAVERQAEWFCVNELPESEILHALMASAALPLILGPRKVGSRRYLDGGLTDNVPLRPLVANCRCDLIVVVHLNGDDRVHSRQFRNVGILEIRPRRSLNPAGLLGGFNGMLDFSPARVDDLIAEGRRDAQQAIDLLRGGFTAIRQSRQSTAVLLEALSDLES
jgi:NTE family protein